MKLSEFFKEENVSPQLKARDKKSVLEELAELVCLNDPSVDKGALVEVLVEREHLGSTGIGDGVAIPHGKLSSVSEPVISFGRSKEGLDFDSMDGQPAHLFFLLIAPENSSGVHLQALARIAKILKSDSFRKRLMETETKEEIYQEIIRTDEKH